MSGWDALGGIAGAVGSYFGNRETNAANERIAAQNIAAQREFAQHGVRWKVADAQAAGIHPLAALGASTTSFSPVSVGRESNADAYSSMGQNIARAMKAAMQDEEREKVDEHKARQLQIENQGLQNDILRTKLASDRAVSGRTSGMLGPPLNLPGRIPLPRPGPARTISEGEAVKDDDIKQKAEDYPQTKIARPFGYAVRANPYFGDGQSFEDRYGDSEVGSTIKFGVNTLADHAYTAYHDWVPYLWRRYKRYQTGYSGY